MRKSNLSYISIQTNLMCHFFVKYLACILLSLFGVIEGVVSAVNERPQKVTEELTGFTKIIGVEPITDITTWVFEEGTFRPTAKQMNK